MNKKLTIHPFPMSGFEVFQVEHYSLKTFIQESVGGFGVFDPEAKRFIPWHAVMGIEVEDIPEEGEDAS